MFTNVHTLLLMYTQNREPSQCPSRQLSEPLLQSKSGGGVSLNRPAGRDDIHQLLPHFMINPTSIDYSPSCVDFENPDQFSMEGSTQAIGDHDPASEDGLSTT